MTGMQDAQIRADRTRDQRIEDAVTGACYHLGSRRNNLVPLARLREHLARIPRSQLDWVLARMEDRHVIWLTAASAPSKADKAAAIRIGGRDRHVIALR